MATKNFNSSKENSKLCKSTKIDPRTIKIPSSNSPNDKSNTGTNEEMNNNSNKSSNEVINNVGNIVTNKNSNKDSNGGVDKELDKKELEVLLREQGGKIEVIYKRLHNQFYNSLPSVDIESSFNLALFKAYQSYNPSKSSYTSYLYKVAYNFILEDLRIYKRHNGQYTTTSGNTRLNVSYDGSDELFTAVEFAFNPLGDTAREVDAKECLRVVLDYLESFHPNTKQTILLRMKGYRMKDIAKKLEISSPAVNNYIVRFKKKFLNQYPYYKEYLSSL